MLSLLLIIVACVGLWLACDWVLNQLLWLIPRLGLPPIIFALLILFLGMDFPEIVLVLRAPDINALGFEAGRLLISHALGAAILFLLLGLGLLARLGYMSSFQTHSIRQLVFEAIVAWHLLVLILYDGTVSVIDGYILLVVFFAYCVLLFLMNRTDRLPEEVVVVEDWLEYVQAGVIFILGATGIWFFSDMLISNSILFLDQFDLNESAIGASIFAVGTSIPELTLLLAAIYREDRGDGIVLSSIVGSSMMGVLLPLAILGIFFPVSFVFSDILIDVILLFVASIWVFFMFRSDWRFNPWISGFALVLYAGYWVFRLLFS